MTSSSEACPTSFALNLISSSRERPGKISSGNPDAHDAQPKADSAPRPSAASYSVRVQVPMLWSAIFQVASGTSSSPKDTACGEGCRIGFPAITTSQDFDSAGTQRYASHRYCEEQCASSSQGVCTSRSSSQDSSSGTESSSTNRGIAEERMATRLNMRAPRIASWVEGPSHDGLLVSVSHGRSQARPVTGHSPFHFHSRGQIRCSAFQASAR